MAENTRTRCGGGRQTGAVPDHDRVDVGIVREPSRAVGERDPVPRAEHRGGRKGRDQGFALWRLENLVHYGPERLNVARPHFLLAGDPNPANQTWAPHGQLFWAQAIYIPARLTPAQVGALDVQEAIIGAVAAGLYGLWDLSIDLTRRSGDLARADHLKQLLGSD